MSEIIPFPAKPEPTEAQVACDVFSLEHGPRDLIPALYQAGDAIPVQLRQDERILLETEVRTLADYQRLRAEVAPAPEVKLYYRITGTIRFRWLWLWGEDWESSPEQAFQLLQERFGRNMREEWMAERQAHGMFKDESIVYRSFIPCDWATFPDSFPYTPKAKRFRMAVLNGKAAYQALPGHEQRLWEEELRNSVTLNILDPDDWLRFQSLREINDPKVLLVVDLMEPGALERYIAFENELSKRNEEARAKGELPPLSPTPPRPGEPISNLQRANDRDPNAH